MKQIKLGRNITSEMSSKQGINSPTKANQGAQEKQNKFSNEYIIESKRSSLKNQNLGATITNQLAGDSNPLKFGQNMKHSENIAMKEPRLDTSAEHFDSSDFKEDLDRVEQSGEQLIEQPTENIQDISMAVSHIKTPKKVSDMRSSKPGK